MFTTDDGVKLLNYIAEVSLKGRDGMGAKPKPKYRDLELPNPYNGTLKDGAKAVLDKEGPEALSKWVMAKKEVLLSDLTLRDAHQSLFATRMRTKDIMRVIHDMAGKLPEMFSFECWGGATFDVAYRFLDESPWTRLEKMRAAAPNMLLQMLLRGANAVGYTSYPDNVVKEFIKLSAKNGVDVFRVFDSLNGIENMQLSIDTVRECNKFAEGTLCYTGDILDPNRPKYNLKYYVTMAKTLEKAGANSIAIKDMAGVLRPQAAYELVKALKENVGIPIHLHSHEGTGNTVYTLARAIDAGVDIVDTAFSSMAGGTSHASSSSLYYALSGHPRQPKLNVEAMNEFSRYFEVVRSYYANTDKTDKYPNPEVYVHEMPGGQFTNLRNQAIALGIGNKWGKVKDMYHRVSMMFGDIIKVTPSSKTVGDMALYMVMNNLDEETILGERGKLLSYPKSVVEFFEGRLGTPYMGFPEELRKIVLKGKKPIDVRPGAVLPDIDFEEVKNKIKEFDAPETEEAVSSYCLYDDVFKTWCDRVNKYGDISLLDTPTFFYGMEVGESISVELAPNAFANITMLAVSEPNEENVRVVSFDYNGTKIDVEVK